MNYLTNSNDTEEDFQKFLWLDSDYFRNLASQYHKSYIEAQPFPHVVIDNFLPQSVADQILRDFPSPNSIDWISYDADQEKKLESRSELQIGKITRFVLLQLNSSFFIEFLEELTGIEKLIPDPHFFGGGLHQIERGGYLKIHSDFNKHENLKLDRRLNLLLYLNKNWTDEYGGHLELWDQKMKSCQKRILPIFNRCVIFNTTDYSYHGHPDPLNCPEGWTRKSLALYYYSNGRPVEEVSDSRSTVFKERPGEVFKETYSAKNIYRQIMPPILRDLIRNIKRSLK